MKHIVYILLSEKNQNRYYIGLTQNLELRLKFHNEGSDGYSKRYAPWKVETFITFQNEKKAIAFEKYLKAGSGQAFLKKRFIESFPESVPAKPIPAIVSRGAK